MSSHDPARRRFLVVGATACGALLVGWRVPAQVPLPYRGARVADSPLGEFVRIDADGTISIGARGCEVGQGVKTLLPMLIAEELDVDWTQVRVRQLPYGFIATDAGASDRYGDQGPQGDATPAAWNALRQAGATARWLLVQAAAQQWNADAAALRTEAGFVVSTDGRRAAYAALAAVAATLDPPAQPLPLKPASQFRIIGQPLRSVDARELVQGRASYSSDAFAGNALVAVIARCPFIDGSIESLDDAAARQVPGVRQVVVLPAPKADAPFDGALAAGVAVLAEDTWSALRGRAALEIAWKPAPAWANDSTAALQSRASALLDGSARGVVVRNDGDFPAVRKQARANSIQARYQVPMLAHAMMEPPNALIDIGKNSVSLVAGLHDPAGASHLLHALTGVPREAIDIRLPRAGGDFGRRLHNDFVAEAALIARDAGRPVKVLWTRTDDLRHDFYRPFGVHELAAVLDRKGRISGWSHRCAATPVNWRNGALAAEPAFAGLFDASTFPAGLVANLLQEFLPLPCGQPRADDRGGGHAFQAFATQVFLDEIAVATHQDPVVLRMDLLGAPRMLRPDFDTGRLAEVLRLAAGKIDWQRKRTNGHGLGIACHAGDGAYCAHAFEVSMQGEQLQIHRAVCAIDAGQVLNPRMRDMQVMCATLGALSGALQPAITLKDGQVQQRGFADYPLMRMAQAPDAVEVHAVDSTAEPAGADAIVAASAVPALANAIHAATTVRVRKLPLMPELLRLL